ncbi:MAG: hypothetical protein QOC87_2209 [Actinomycetota bacterium]|nr:hypothetical protein [Actinomycetota bacterium]
MRPIAIVQHEALVPPGSIEDVLEGAGVDHFIFEAWREKAWPTADDLAGLVVLGGTMNVDELDDFPFLRSSRELISQALDKALPTLGVCLGSQMMARVLGGDVFRAEPRNALFSPLEVAEPDDPVIAPFASGAPVLQFHEDTFTVPFDAVPLATSATTGLAQAFRYGDNAYAIQFHFEVDKDIVRDWCADIGDRSLTEDWNTSTEQLLAEADTHVGRQYGAGKELLLRFLQLTTAAALK